VDFAEPCGSNRQHADEIAAAVEDLATASGASSIAVVAHSMGGLALRWYLSQGGAARVATAVFVGTPHRGTWSAWLAWGAGAAEMRPGSTFLRELNAAPVPAAVRTCCVRTPIDTHVVPSTSAFLAGAECYTVRLPIHQRMLRHRGTLELICSLLRRESRTGA
jgi:triacylglycerol lipase